MSVLGESISSCPVSSDLKAATSWTWFGPRAGISVANQGPQASRESVGVSESIVLRFRITKPRSRDGPNHDMLASPRLVKFGQKVTLVWSARSGG